MLEQLPEIPEPEWLSESSRTSMVGSPLPIDDVLRDSLYYPSSEFDGDPVRHLGGNVLSFIYVDYGQDRESLQHALDSPGFLGYEVLATREVEEHELVPRGWTPAPPSREDGNPQRFLSFMKRPFCTWAIMQRLANRSASHGPRRFSLLYLCADGVAAFQALYVANRAVPAYIAIIQPGHAFGANWTDFEDPNRIFARSVLGNPAGSPKYLLHGGDGERERYPRACWPRYSERICFLERARGGTLGLWAEPNRS